MPCFGEVALWCSTTCSDAKVFTRVTKVLATGVSQVRHWTDTTLTLAVDFGWRRHCSDIAPMSAKANTTLTLAYVDTALTQCRRQSLTSARADTAPTSASDVCWAWHSIDTVSDFRVVSAYWQTLSLDLVMRRSKQQEWAALLNPPFPQLCWCHHGYIVPYPCKEHKFMAI